MPNERKAQLSLTFNETGVLCHVLMRAMLEGRPKHEVVTGDVTSELRRQPAFVIELYEKLAKTNDSLRSSPTGRTDTPEPVTHHIKPDGAIVRMHKGRPIDRP